MEKTYNLSELALMTGFTTRTLRSYLSRGLLDGEKVDGTWQFTAEDLDRFFQEPFVKEGLRIKRNAMVFDFLADSAKKADRACVILDLPTAFEDSRALSDFFCAQMEQARDVEFGYHWDRGLARVILTGDESQVAKILKAYQER